MSKEIKKQKIGLFTCHTKSLKKIQLNMEYFIHMKGGAVLAAPNKEKYPREASLGVQFKGDDTGDNISKKNKSYCELTVQYWAWKNTNYDYYGFFHYRRFLSFNQERLKVDKWNKVVIRPFLDKKIIEELHLNNYDHINKIIDGYDIITPVPVNLKHFNFPSVYEQYKADPYLNIKDLDIVLGIIKEKYPEYYDDANEYIYNCKIYICNIFLMKKELFNNYCQWLFAILQEFENRADLSSYNKEALRTPGHLGERLFGIYYTHIKKTNEIKDRELQLVFIERPGDEAKILKILDIYLRKLSLIFFPLKTKRREVLKRLYKFSVFKSDKRR